jgi:hypothetical protein
MNMKYTLFALIAILSAGAAVSARQVTKETRDGIKNFSRLETTVAVRRRDHVGRDARNQENGVCVGDQSS